MPTTREEIPIKLKPFCQLGFEFSGSTGTEYYGECPFCGRPDKFYINTETQQWSCKSAHCGKAGNIYQYMEQWCKSRVDFQGVYLDKFEDLANDRGIPVSRLRATELIWDYETDRWALPVRNKDGSIVHIYTWNPKGKRVWYALKGIQHGLYGAEQLKQRRPQGPNKPTIWIYVVEGFWDKMALEQLLEECGQEGIVLAVPGFGVFKDSWIELLADQYVAFIYDNDKAGDEGMRRVAPMIAPLVNEIQLVQWPRELPEGYDINDFYRTDGMLAELISFLRPFESRPQVEKVKSVKQLAANFPPISGRKTSLEETLEVYEKHLYMTNDMRDAMRIIYAVIYSNQLSGPPLWMFIAGPPGSAKTELLMSCSSCEYCITRSTVTAHTLVSGYQLKGDRDPSLIPQLIGRVFILKDWTEILQMNKTHKDEIYSTLRGAHDGRVEKPFGNGTYREYEGYFSILAGVTQVIYGEQGGSVGERFLIFYMSDEKMTDHSPEIRIAMENVGSEDVMKVALSDAAKRFLEWKVSPEDIPKISEQYYNRLSGLAQVVSILRATVDRDGYKRDMVKYRPHYEIGTRPAIELVRLLIGLGLQHNPPEITEDDYRIVKRVAMNSCNNWNMAVMRFVSRAPGGVTLSDIQTALGIPRTTLKERIDDLEMIGALTRTAQRSTSRGRPPSVYHMSEMMRFHWMTADINPIGEISGKENRVTRQSTVLQNGHVSGKIVAKRRMRNRIS